MKRTFLACALALGALLAQDPHDEPPGPQPPTVGEPAPVFRLNDQDGAAVAVGGQSQTWTVVAFYPKAATPG